MFHAIRAGGRKTALGRSYPNVQSQPDWKGPLRCGVVFCTACCILFVIGVILTWLGRSVHDVFGESVPITGPILLAVGGLMLLLAFRQFYMARARKKQQKAAADKAAVATVVVDKDDGYGPSTLVMGGIKDKDEHDEEGGERQPCDGYSNDIHLPSSPPLEAGTYVWPAIPSQSPYYSMAMMLYKDPVTMLGPLMARNDYSDNFNPNPIGISPTSPSSQVTGATAATSDAAAPLLSQHSNSPNEINLGSPSVVGGHSTAACNSSALFSSGGLLRNQNKKAEGLPALLGATCGLGNLPNRTAFMMLKTLEIQETI